MNHAIQLDHIVSKVRAAAAGSVGVLSTGEQLMAALTLNRPDWLAEWNFTIAEAIDRVGSEWASVIPRVADEVRQLQAHDEDADAATRKAMALAKAKVATHRDDRDEIDCEATLVTYGSAPGYRGARFIFDLLPLGSNDALRVYMRVRPDDAEPIVRHLREVHQLAWRGEGPLDVQPGESRPRWIDRA